MITDIPSNLQEIQNRIHNACQRAGRSPEEVTLIAVSKYQPIPSLEQAYQWGCRHFGENRVQELMEKHDVMPQDIQWHMIGHLQRNKVKYVIGRSCLIHSVDSLRLAEEISRESQKKDVTSRILLEVNVAEEESKFGMKNEEVPLLVSQIAALPNLKIEGLMTIAPYVQNPEENRKHFSKLKNLSVDILNKSIDNVSMNVLSMGMTGDFEVAIEEGATCVRVGTGIFGERI